MQTNIHIVVNLIILNYSTFFFLTSQIEKVKSILFVSFLQSIFTRISVSLLRRTSAIDLSEASSSSISFILYCYLNAYPIANCHYYKRACLLYYLICSKPGAFFYFPSLLLCLLMKLIDKYKRGNFYILRYLQSNSTICSRNL